jgi:hypothetical protein
VICSETIEHIERDDAVIGEIARVLRPHFTIEEWMPVTFGWTGKFGGVIDRMVRVGVLKRFSKSIAFVARLNRPPNLRN